jgi:hypothetical protein
VPHSGHLASGARPIREYLQAGQRDVSRNAKCARQPKPAHAPSINAGIHRGTCTNRPAFREIEGRKLIVCRGAREQRHRHSYVVQVAEGSNPASNAKDASASFHTKTSADPYEKPTDKSPPLAPKPGPLQSKLLSN